MRTHHYHPTNPMPVPANRRTRLRYYLHRKLRQSSRISRKSLEFTCLLIGAVLVALASLTFLVVIHKLEYFLNAKIIGAEIESTAWELLLVMVIFERIFGIGGIIIAPVYYAYVKNELKRQGLL